MVGRESEEKLDGGDGEKREGEDAATSLWSIASFKPHSLSPRTPFPRLGGASGLLPHSPLYLPELGQLGGMRISHCSRDFCSPLPGAGMLAALLAAKLESPPLFMLLLKHINPYISAGIFFMGAVR